MLGVPMKTYLTYGAIATVASALLTLAMYFLGFHSDLSKIQSGQWLGMVGSVVIWVACIVLGTKARRAEVPSGEEFGYGRALVAGLMIAVFGGIFGAIFGAIYFGAINPDFAQVMTDFQVAQMEANGTPPEAIEMSQKWMKVMMGPVAMTIFSLLGTVFWGALISLVTAAFLKRPASGDVPPALA